MNPQMNKLLQPEFDQASFLYNMYKSCTMDEIEDFKVCLNEIRESTIQQATQSTLTSQSRQLSQLAKDLIDIDNQVKQKMLPSISRLDEANKSIQDGLLAQVRELKEQARKLVVIQKCEEVIRETQLVYSCLQRVGYAYDFSQGKILDPLSLSVAIKQLGVLSPDQRQKLSDNIPQVAQKLKVLEEVQVTLNSQTLARFQEAFEGRDQQTLVQCIQVFFNLEILSDQIQSRVNTTLRALFSSWKTQVNGLNDKVKGEGSQDEETQMVDRAIVTYVNEMAKHTLKVYQLAAALSERDPSSAANFETMQETLQHSGLANIFNLYWEKLCHILKQSLGKVQSLYAYLFASLSGRYSVFLAQLKLFWDRILTEVQPNDKIKLLELKHALFASIDTLRQRYFDQFIIKQLCNIRIQITEVLEDSLENLDKYKVVAGKKGNDIVNPYKTEEELEADFDSGQDLKTMEKSQLEIRVGRFLAAVDLHLATVNTQLDMRSDVIEMVRGQTTNLLQTDLTNCIIKVQFNEEEQEQEPQQQFNMVIFDLAKQVATYFSSEKFQKLIDAESKLQCAKQLRQLQSEAQRLCGILFEKVYSQFIANLQRQIYFTLQQVFQGGIPESPSAQAEPPVEDQKQGFTEQLESWKGTQIDQIFKYFLPSKIADFNAQFQTLLTRMTLSNLPGSLTDQEQAQWIKNDLNVRLIDCVDQILHFFVIKTLQIDYESYSAMEKSEIYAAFKEMFDAMVDAFGSLIEIQRNSRLVARNQKFLQCLQGFTEVHLPLHLRACFRHPEVKAFTVLTVYKLEKQLLKSQINQLASIQPQIKQQLTTAYEDIDKGIESLASDIAVDDGEEVKEEDKTNTDTAAKVSENDQIKSEIRERIQRLQLLA